MAGVQNEHAGHNQTTLDVSSAVETNQVSYQDSGFSPAVIKVKLGTTVTFTNNSSGPMDVASGPHPSHDAYPEFDSKEAVAAGKSYSFTFGKVGSWSYHNHLNDAQAGVVIVE